MTGCPLSTNVLHTPIYCMHPFGKKRYISASIHSYYLKHYSCLFIHNVGSPNMCIIGLMSWMTSEFHSYVNLEVSYMFCKVCTSLCLLVSVWNFLRYLYTCGVQQYFNGNNSFFQWTWLALSIYLQYRNYIVWIFITSIYLTLGLMSDYTQLWMKFLLSSQFSSLYGALYQPSELVGLGTTDIIVG